MTMDVKKPIGFSFHRISIEQFAIIEDKFKDGEGINLSTGIEFALDTDNKILICYFTVKYEQSDSPFLLIKCGCHFGIGQESWTKYQTDSATVTFPQGFMAHLATLTVGTTRGVLHVKTEGTTFNRFLLPTVNVMEMIPTDIPFDLQVGQANK